MNELLIFTIDNQQYALPCQNIIKVINSVYITPLPTSNQKIRGIINLHSEVIAILDIRFLMGLPEKEMTLTDKIMIIQTPTRKLGFIVDSVEGIETIDNDKIASMKDIVTSSTIYRGTANFKDKLILVYDNDSFLNISDEELLKEALK